MTENRSRVSLSDPERLKSFRRDIRILEREIEFALLAQTNCCGINLMQCGLLLEVGDWGRGSIGDFALSLEVDPSTLSRTAEALVKAGLLSREDDPANRRRQILGLTEAGRAKVDEIDGLCDRYYGRLLSAIPEEKLGAVFEAVPLLAQALKAERELGSCLCGEGCVPS